MDANKCSKLSICALTFRFKVAPKISIEFKSGEYGGRHRSLHPTDSINSFIFLDL